MKNWAVKNTTKTTEIYIFDKHTGTITLVFELREKLTNVIKVTDGTNIEELCSGLLEVVNTED